MRAAATAAALARCGRRRRPHPPPFTTSAAASTTASPSSTVDADAVVVGAGVVGLAAARALARRGRDVLLLDARPEYGQGTTSRSSEVVHAGLYYPPSSLKARFCVAGSASLAAYAAARGIPHATPGKLVVAVEEGELAALASLEANARASGVADLARLSPTDASALEPGLAPVAGALLSPHTGIVDSHALCTALLADAEAGGRTVFLPRAAVVGGRLDPQFGGGRLVVVESSSDTAATPTTTILVARSIILAAGLGTPRLVSSLAGLGGVPPGLGRWVAKGNYFRAGAGTRPPFTRLIYPLPPAAGGGLGVHLTLDLGGGARFGPDVEWMEVGGRDGGDGLDACLGPPGTADPAPNPDRAEAFAASIRRWWPGLPDAPSALVPDYAGVRPKLTGPGDPPGDFIVSGPPETGIPGVVALYGIESPGMTAAMPLGEAAAASACGNEAWRGGGALDCGV